MTGFRDRVILISGATGGFGSAAARMFSEDGARLVLTDLDPDGLESLADSLDAETICIAGDIAQPETARSWVDAALARFGQIDAAFNNAGIEHRMAWTADLDADSSRRVLEVNVLGLQLAMQAQLKAMMPRAKEGQPSAILNTASVAGVMGAPKLSAYAASKHAVVGLGRSAAIEYARFGIRVNTLCPAFMKTRMVLDGIVKDFPTPEEGFRKLAAGIPMGRIGEVDEILPAVRFALDPANTFFTGQEICLDGGMSA